MIRLLQFHENSKVISGWLALAGPALKWLTPARRRTILIAGALWIALKRPLKQMTKAHVWSEVPPDLITAIVVTIIIFAFLWFCYWLALKFTSMPSFIRRNPQLCLHAFFWIILVVLWNTSPEGGIWRVVLVVLAINLPFLLWRLGYMLISAKHNKVAGTRFWEHLMYLAPVYGGTNTPYGKGLDFLSRHEAKDEEALARSQLAGIKLLILAVLWQGVRLIMDGLVFGINNPANQVLGGFTLAVPRLGQLLKQPEIASIGTAWVSLYCELIYNVLNLAVRGHQIIGILRLSGFYVFRNTYKPLLAETIVEFWNRYYYYFKEIMADFFFFPTFVSWFRKHFVLRLFSAVFMAAFFGNMYYHLIRLKYQLIQADFNAIWLTLHARLFYCFLLSLGIFISMLREHRRGRKPRPRRGLMQRGLSIFGVWTFFAIINIWNQKGGIPFVQVTKFFLRLIGII
ncbi:MAG: hypothetical protein OS130_02955 [Thermodesulfobacteriota bacterium]|jgi:hypothetical protein|nr:MAG: hypothetical protein OS130_02955 [Thermodesulfobacteriota bacterium]